MNEEIDLGCCAAAEGKPDPIELSRTVSTLRRTRTGNVLARAVWDAIRRFNYANERRGKKPPRPDAPRREAPVKIEASRNDPCPCGSGKKYKRCCRPTGQGGTAGPAAERGPGLTLMRKR